MSNQQQKRVVENRKSSLLSTDENEAVFQLLGRKCVTLSTAVVQLLMTSPPHQSWHKKHFGVACFVKDSSQRSYFIRIFDIIRNVMLWEQELYSQFTYLKLRPFLHCFEAEDGMAGLLFADSSEAETFQRAVELKLKGRQQKKQEKKSRNPDVAQPTQSGIGLSVPSGPLSSNKSESSSGKKSKKNKKPSKLTKADIGLPTDFKHVEHFGFKPSTGLEFRRSDDLDPELEGFFCRVGISQKHLQDKKTRDFIYKFIDDFGGIEEVKKEVKNETSRFKPQAPPPVPTRELPPTPKTSRGAAPPPPPARMTPMASPIRNQGAAPPPPPPPPVRPPVGGGGKGNAPLPPPPPPSLPSGPPAAVSGGGGGFIPPPPPPPPPPPADLPPMPTATASVPSTPSFNPRAALLDEIRQGRNLQHVDPGSTAAANRVSDPVDSRGELLKQIRSGIELNKVCDSPKSRPPSPPPVMMGGIAGALAKALEERAKAMQLSDESDSDDDDDDGFDDDEWN